MAGLCVSPGFIPTRDELSALNPSYLRSILYTLDDLDTLLATDMPLMLTINNQMDLVGGDWSGWDAALDTIGQKARGRVFAIGCGNELDKYWAANEDDCPPSFAAALVRRAAPILKKYGIKTIATSVVSSRWPEYLQRMADLCRVSADYFDLHPYGKQAEGWRFPGDGTGSLKDALQLAAQITDRPIIMSEIGGTIEMCGGEDGVASYLTAVDDTVHSLPVQTVSDYAWFAYRDQVGAPDERGLQAFGLMAEDDRKRPAWQAYTDLTRVSNPLPIEPTEGVTPPMVDTSMPPIIQAWAHLWTAANPALAYDEAVHGFGIPTWWRDNFKDIGSPLSAEIPDADGTVLQTFTLGIVRWTGNGVERVA